MLDWLFYSGAVVWLALAFLILEAGWLIIVMPARSRTRRLWCLLANIAAGASILLALRAALVGQQWPWLAGWLLAGLVAHLIDLRLRLATIR